MTDARFKQINDHWEELIEEWSDRNGGDLDITEEFCEWMVLRLRLSAAEALEVGASLGIQMERNRSGKEVMDSTVVVQESDGIVYHYNEKGE